MSNGEYVQQALCDERHQNLMDRLEAFERNLAGRIEGIAAAVKRVEYTLNGNGKPGLVAQVDENRRAVERLAKVDDNISKLYSEVKALSGRVGTIEGRHDLTQSRIWDLFLRYGPIVLTPTLSAIGAAIAAGMVVK